MQGSPSPSKALHWLGSIGCLRLLPPLSRNYLWSLFHTISARTHFKLTSYLLSINQKPDELLRKYVQHFIQESLKVDDLHGKVALTDFMVRLQTYDFIFIESKNPYASMTEVLVKVEKIHQQARVSPCQALLFSYVKPEVSNLEFVSQFRPIGLCYVLYKIISKFLANRFNILPSILSEN